MKLSRDFKEFVECLNVNDVRYLVIGGYAVAYHGRPRYTKDLDIWLEASHDNGQKMVQALERFGFQSWDSRAADIVRARGRLHRLGPEAWQLNVC